MPFFRKIFFTILYCDQKVHKIKENDRIRTLFIHIYQDAKKPPQGAAVKKGEGRRPSPWDQQSFAPAGMASSTMIRCSFSSPFSVWTAERSMPQLSWPIIFRGGRFTMATSVLPISSSGL